MALPEASRRSSAPAAASTLPPAHRLRAALGAIAFAGVVAVVSPQGIADASTITPKAFCAKISGTTVSSLFGQKVSLLGAAAEASAYNDVCEFGKVVGKSVEGVTMNYDYKSTGTASQDNISLSKERGVSGFVLKPYSPVGGTTYSFTDIFSDTVTGTKIKESGMVSYNGTNHYGVIVDGELSTSTLGKLLKLVVNAA